MGAFLLLIAVRQQAMVRPGGNDALKRRNVAGEANGQSR
jgi:hypothetical protein